MSGLAVIEDEPQGSRPDRPWGSVLARLSRRQESAVLLALLALFLVFTVARPENFATADNLKAVARDASVLLILAVGITYATVMGVFDLSIGSVLVFAQVIAVKVMGSVGGEGLGVALLGAASALAAGVAWGALNGVLVARLKLSPFIVTLATLGAALGAAQLVADGNDLTDVPPGLSEAIGIDELLGIPTLTVIALVVAILLGVFLVRSRYGRITYAIGSNQEAARRAGIDVDRHVVSVYMLIGLLVGLAGFLSASRFGTTSLGGFTNAPLDAITAVALGGASLYGGVGTVLGSAIGVCIPAVLQNGLVILGTQPYWYQIIVAAALIASIYLDQRRRSLQQRR